MNIASFSKSIVSRVLPYPILQFVKKIYYVRVVKSVTEKDEPDLKIVRHLAGQGDTVADIGANIGVYTLFLSKLVGERGHVYSVEPIPVTFSILSNNIKKLRLANVKAFNYAISSQNGLVNMEVPKREAGNEDYYMARIIDADKRDASLKQFQIKSSTLDSLLFARDRKIAFLKIDVEGHEVAVLQGASKIIDSHRPAMLMEILDDPEDRLSSAFTIFNMLNKKGYRPYLFDGTKLNLYVSGHKSVNYFFMTDEHVRKCGF